MTAAFRVVLADDVEDMRELIAAGLEASGRFEVVARASDGAEALEAVRLHQPDLALIDLGMPGVGGLEVLPDLRAASPATRVVVVSGFPRRTLADVAVARGAVGYVEKGLSIRRLVDEVVAVAGVLETVELALAESRARLEKDPRSGAAARRFMTETLERWECADVLDVVTLLVSELVTNAVVHADSDADVAVVLTPSAVRIEVGDQSEFVPGAHEAADDETSGRGLAIVEAMASDWGVIPRPGGKVIWFEVPRPDGAAPPVEV